jgi:hypothetical protein
MDLHQYTKKELVDMLTATFEPLEYYARLEVSFVANGKPFALPQERKAQPALTTIRAIQKEALERIKESANKPATAKRATRKRNIQKDTGVKRAGTKGVRPQPE